MTALARRDQFLIVSDPPHGTADPSSAAPCVGLPTSAVRLKAKYGIPEIWVADQSRIRIHATAQTLRLAGHNLTVVPGRALLLPPRQCVRSFDFGDQWLNVRAIDGSERAIPYDTPVVAVLCTPGRASGPTGNGSGGCVESADAATFLDLYVSTNTGLVRFAFVEGETDLSRLASIALEGGAEPVARLALECEQRFVDARLDRRLVDMRPRQLAATERAGYHHGRRGYSYATAALSRLLSTIAPELDELSHMELSSRLTYLTISRDGQAVRR